MDSWLNWAGGTAIAMLSAALAWIAGAFRYKQARGDLERDAASRAEVAVAGKISHLESQIAVLTERIYPISAMFQAMLVKELTHNHTPEFDYLLTRIGKLTGTETNRFCVLLKERVVEFKDPLITESEREAAIILPYVMKRTSAEAAREARRIVGNNEAGERETG